MLSYFVSTYSNAIFHTRSHFKLQLKFLSPSPITDRLEITSQVVSCHNIDRTVPREMTDFQFQTSYHQRTHHSICLLMSCSKANHQVLKHLSFIFSDNRYQCVKLKKRNEQVIEVYQGMYIDRVSSCKI